jgi:hypothetical protein
LPANFQHPQGLSFYHFRFANLSSISETLVSLQGLHSYFMSSAEFNGTQTGIRQCVVNESTHDELVPEKLYILLTTENLWMIVSHIFWNNFKAIGLPAQPLPGHPGWLLIVTKPTVQ